MPRSLPPSILASPPHPKTTPPPPPNSSCSLSFPSLVAHRNRLRQGHKWRVCFYKTTSRNILYPRETTTHTVLLALPYACVGVCMCVFVCALSCSLPGLQYAVCVCVWFPSICLAASAMYKKTGFGRITFDRGGWQLRTWTRGGARKRSPPPQVLSPLHQPPCLIPVFTNY